MPQDPGMMPGRSGLEDLSREFVFAVLPTGADGLAHTNHRRHFDGDANEAEDIPRG